MLKNFFFIILIFNFLIFKIHNLNNNISINSFEHINYCPVTSIYTSYNYKINTKFNNTFYNNLKISSKEKINSSNLNLIQNDFIINKQKNIINNLLKKLITGDYILLDLPYYSNIGDALIWKGTEDFLSTTSYKCIYRCSLETFVYQNLSENIVIIMMGGGNFGDIYPQHNKFRSHILISYPNNKIIILPQTVYYKNIQNAKKDAIIFSQHKNLIIFARDNFSFNFLNNLKFSNKIKLMPDMAFYINLNWLKTMKMPLNGKNLFFKRIDIEAKKLNYTSKMLGLDNYDINDWPLYGKKDPMLKHLLSLIKMHKFNEANEYAIKIYLPNRIRLGVNFISQYKKIVSNRLHAAILSILLNKEIVILDNSYGKNSQYYNTWLQKVNGITLNSI